MKTPNDKKTVLHLLTEIAMVEHLLRNRHDKVTPAGMTTGQFGVLTHFIRNEKSRERLSLLAWAFQDDDAYMAQKVTSLVERDLLTTVAVEGSSSGDLWVEITEAGREAHARAIDEISPEVAQFIEGIDMGEMETALRVIREIRRTLDNLPDR
jgi:DNA-binding MarR family transcriptional regulator